MQKQPQGISRFKHSNVFEVLIPELSAQPTRPAKFEVGTDVLWASDSLEHQALLQWRLVTPFGVLVLGLIGRENEPDRPKARAFC
jgi:lipopolysaccharide export system permease protein